MLFSDLSKAGLILVQCIEYYVLSRTKEKLSRKKRQGRKKGDERKERKNNSYHSILGLGCPTTLHSSLAELPSSIVIFSRGRVNLGGL